MSKKNDFKKKKKKKKKKGGKLFPSSPLSRSWSSRRSSTAPSRLPSGTSAPRGTAATSRRAGPCPVAAGLSRRSRRPLLRRRLRQRKATRALRRRCRRLRSLCDRSGRSARFGLPGFVFSCYTGKRRWSGRMIRGRRAAAFCFSFSKKTGRKKKAWWKSLLETTADGSRERGAGDVDLPSPLVEHEKEERRRKRGASTLSLSFLSLSPLSLSLSLSHPIPSTHLGIREQCPASGAHELGLWPACDDDGKRERSKKTKKKDISRSTRKKAPCVVALSFFSLFPVPQRPFNLPAIAEAAAI